MLKEKLDREKLIHDYLPLVRAIVSEVLKKVGRKVDPDELEAYGRLGLVDAGNKYNPDFQCSFKTYAYYRVKGAILDALRYDKSLRDNRELLYMEGANYYLGASSVNETVNEDYRRFNELKNCVNSLATISLLTECEENSENKFLVRELEEELKRAIRKLNEKERELIRMYYFEDISFSEIAQRLKISTPALSRLHKKAIERLRSLLTKDEE